MNITASSIAFVLATTAWGDEPKFKLEVGHDITRVETPVLADGTIDYVEAYWNQQATGVTQGNNAAALLEGALREWKKYFRGAKGDEWERRDKQLTNALRGPWNPADLPDVAAWLHENDAALRLSIDASRRSRLFFSKPDEKSPHVGWTPGLSGMHELGTALIVRANGLAGQNQQGEARENLAALHRLTRLLASEPHVMRSLVAEALDRRGFAAALAAVRTADSREARAWLDWYSRLEELGTLARAIDVEDRYSMLNRVMRIIRGEGQQVLGEITMLDVKPLFVEKKAAAILPGDLDQVDWNLVLRRINDVYDQATVIASRKDALNRSARWREFIGSLKAAQAPGTFFDAMGGSLLEPAKGDYEAREKKLIKDVEEFLRRRKDENRQAYSERIAHYFMQSVTPLGKAMDLLDQSRCEQRIYTVAMAIETYWTDKRQYPETLKVLTGSYLKTLPEDVFSGKELIYRRKDGGYVLYSVGPDGRDDGGEKLGRDDIGVRGAPR